MFVTCVAITIFINLSSSSISQQQQQATNSSDIVTIFRDIFYHNYHMPVESRICFFFLLSSVVDKVTEWLSNIFHVISLSECEFTVWMVYVCYCGNPNRHRPKMKRRASRVCHRPRQSRREIRNGDKKRTIFTSGIYLKMWLYLLISLLQIMDSTSTPTEQRELSVWRTCWI